MPDCSSHGLRTFCQTPHEHRSHFRAQTLLAWLKNSPDFLGSWTPTLTSSRRHLMNYNSSNRAENPNDYHVRSRYLPGVKHHEFRIPPPTPLGAPAIHRKRSTLHSRLRFTGFGLACLVLCLIFLLYARDRCYLITLCSHMTW